MTMLKRVEKQEAVERLNTWDVTETRQMTLALTNVSQLGGVHTPHVDPAMRMTLMLQLVLKSTLVV